MKITGAVLERIGEERPYAVTRPISIAEVDLQGPGPGEILVRMEAAGLCHSDLSVVNGSRVRPVPMLLGHEACGRVERLGEGVESLAVGQRVAMTFLPRCGACSGCATDGKLPCVPGTIANNAGELLGGRMLLSRDGEPIYHHLGVSGFADHAVVNALSVVPLPDDVPPDIGAVLGCAVLTGGGAVLNAGNPQAGDDVIVVGLGGVGMASILVAAALGRGRVIGVDALPAKLETVREFGADDAFTPADALEAGLKAPVVIEAAGHPRAFESAVKLTAAGGITVTVGLPAPTDTATITPLGLTAEARTIVGSYLGSAVPSRDIPSYVEMWRSGTLPVDKLISSHIKLSDINQAMDDLADGSELRQIIEFG